tara:strand:+ start:119 stop:613 length:495 start_codon:yes stop_codon:yes gene_type:complete
MSNQIQPFDNKISQYANFDQIGGNFRSARNKYLETERKLQNVVDLSTKTEKAELEKAVKKYNDKVKNIIENSEFKKLQQEAESYSKEVSKNLIKAKDEFIKIQNEIMKQDWADEKKQKKIRELYDVILSKLYSKEDIDNFKKSMGNMVVMVMPTSSSKCSKYIM